MITGEYLTILICGDWVFSHNTDSLGCQPFKGASWALVLGLPLRDTIKGLLLVLSPFLISTFGVRPEKFPISGKMAKSKFRSKIRNLFSRSRMTKRISPLESSLKI